MQGLRSGPAMALLVAALLALAVLPGVAAAETRTGGSIVVGANETVEGDLDAFGGSVVVLGTVEGDLDALAGDVRVAGTVEGDVEATAGNVEIAPNGRVGGSLTAATGNLLIAGRVNGSVEAAAERITIARTAIVLGDVEYGGELVREEGARVDGTITRSPDEVGGAIGGFGPSMPGWVFALYWLLAHAVLGGILLFVFPAFSRSVAAQATESPLRSTGIGLLGLVGVPVALVALVMTLVGIPLAVLGGALYLLALWIGAVYGRYAIGTWLLDRADVENRWLALLAGLVLVAAAGRLPILGGLIQLLVMLLGLGALGDRMYARLRRHRGSSADHTDESGTVTEGRPAQG